MKKLIGFGVLAVVLIAAAIGSFYSVNAGEVGIKTRFGAVVGTSEQGPHFKMPFVEYVSTLNIQTQKEQVDATAASADQQDVFTTVAINYNVDASKVGELFTEVGTDYKSKVIDPAIQEVVKSVTAQYTAVELLGKRGQVSDEVKKGLIDRLTHYYIQVSDVSVVNFKYSQVYATAIENKAAAQQDALTAQSKLTQSNLEAQAIKVKSEAANNEKYIQLQQLEVEKSAIEKWNGVLPAQMIPGATLPFINLTK